MVNKKDITVIIPVHKWDDGIKKMFVDAYNSVDLEVNVTVAVPFGTDFDIQADERVKTVYVHGSTCFQNMVNTAVESVSTDWFSILEFDDEYAPNWFSNFIKYQEYNQQYNIFMPLNDLYNVEGGKDEYIGNGNEAVMAASFSDEIGVIDEKSLDDYFAYYLTGSVISTEVFKKLGGLKEDIKLTFWYEFLLRAAHNGEKMYVVPKVGYAHVLGREGSLMDEYRKTIDTKESSFWFEQAKKQSYFKKGKKVEYGKDTVEPEKEENGELEIPDTLEVE